MSNIIKEHLHGLIAAPFTPFHADGSLNLSLIPEYYEMLIANGVTGRGCFHVGQRKNGGS